jgi:hypothetical protein
MRSAPLAALAALMSVGAVACSAAKPQDANADSGTGGAPPLVNCSADVSCGSNAACVANRCVQRISDLGSWAIEIDPPAGSGSQLTEKPAAGRTPTIAANGELMLQVPFADSATTAVPKSATVVVTIPSAIPGQTALAFQANLQPGVPIATVPVPDTIRGQAATVSLIPLPPADQSAPPYTFAVTIPATGSVLPRLALPSSPSIITGQVQDALHATKGNYTARAFQGDVLVSTAGSTSMTTNNAAGTFSILLPPGIGTGTDAADGVALELAPDAGSGDPWITFLPFSVTSASDILKNPVTLPSYAVTNDFQVTVHGGDPDQTPEVGAAVRAFTTFPMTDDRFNTKFFRQTNTNAGGVANLSLIPGDSRVPRTYVVSVVPAPGSLWASQCLSADALWNGGMAATSLRDVTLTRRPSITGTVVSAGGTPVANVVVTAIRGKVLPTDSCLPAPGTTSVTTNAIGQFSLPLDPGNYQLEYDPPVGSAVPRWTELNVGITSSGTTRLVQLPAPALVEGDVQSAVGQSVPNATVRIFEPRCEMLPCTTPPLLRGQTQSDGNGHFRVVVPASSN